MRVIALDTTTRNGSVALVEDEQIVDERASDGAQTDAQRLPGYATLSCDGLGGRDDTARDEALPPSFSLATTKTVSPAAICLPPYIVFCAMNANVFARGSRTSALIANAVLLIRPRTSHR